MLDLSNVRYEQDRRQQEMDYAAQERFVSSVVKRDKPHWLAWLGAKLVHLGSNLQSRYADTLVVNQKSQIANQA